MLYSTSTIDAVNKVVTATSSYLGTFDLQAPLLCPADTVADDTFYDAQTISTDQTPNSRLFDIAQDEDWFQFSATQGYTYTLQTLGLGSGVDTLLSLYDTGGVDLLITDEDSGGGQASLIEWVAPRDGTYFVQVTSVLGSTVGSSAVYQVSILEERTLYQVYLPVVIKGQ